MSANSALTTRLIQAGLEPVRPTRTLAQIMAEHHAMLTLLRGLAEDARKGARVPRITPIRALIECCDALTAEGPAR